MNRAVAFVNIRMPPGWDGMETVQRIWEADPETLIVLCSASSAILRRKLPGGTGAAWHQGAQLEEP